MAFINMKYLLIGLVLGLVVGCGYIAIRYVLSSKLRTAQDLEHGFGITVLGCVAEQNSSKRVGTKEDQIGVIVANVKLIMERQGKQKVFLTGGSATERCCGVIDAIAQGLKDQGMDCAVGVSVVNDVDSISKVADADAVVLVEEIDVSGYETIKKEKELCEQCKIPVLGSVVLVA